MFSCNDKVGRVLRHLCHRLLKRSTLVAWPNMIRLPFLGMALQNVQVATGTTRKLVFHLQMFGFLAPFKQTTKHQQTPFRSAFQLPALPWAEGTRQKQSPCNACSFGKMALAYVVSSLSPKAHHPGVSKGPVLFGGF